MTIETINQTAIEELEQANEKGYTFVIEDGRITGIREPEC